MGQPNDGDWSMKPEVIEQQKHFAHLANEINKLNAFWHKFVVEEEGRSAIINGIAFTIGKEPTTLTNSNCVQYGFGGKRYVVKFLDGTEVVTHNLWHRGTVPDDLRELLSDNARFGR
jgi:hypothetical protein